MEVLLGAPARFECRVAAHPEPQIEWFVDGDRIKEGRRFESTFEGEELIALRITETLAEDEGEYTCKAKNDLGSASTTAELIVNGKRVDFEMI